MPPPATTNPEAIVELRDACLRYGTRPPVQALDGINLTVPRGSFVSLIGPSGCGKSTLLRLVAGILEPTTGTVRVEGGSPDAAQRAHRFGFVFQDPALLPWRSVQDNVELLAELVGQSAADRRARSLELLALVGLDGRERLRPAQLSGGMRQRVAIARALAIGPSILLMDEPFSALDEFQREILNDELLRIWQEQRNSVLFVTHNIEEAVYLSDTVHVLSAGPGRIVESFQVDLPRPRTGAMRVMPEFLQLRRRLRDVLVH
jgi:NitT/TauT family transport system ATP-binding protein